MTYLQAVLYGIVQGLTEWLPISSTAHLRLVPAALGWKDPGSAFTAVIQLGTLLAVLVYFGRDLGRAMSAWAGSLTGKGRTTEDARIGWGVFWGTIPIVVLGFVFKNQIKSEAVRSVQVIGFTLVAMGVLMLLAERFGRKTRPMSDVRVTDGVAVGLWQALALIPGMSRSGSTITGALFQGFDHRTAARYSFLLSVPSVFAAGVYELFDERKNILGPLLGPTLVATVVSFVVGYASIAWLMRYLQRQGTMVFVVYRIALGLVVLAASFSGHLK